MKLAYAFLAWAWLAKPKANVVIPKRSTLAKIFTEKKRVKMRSTAYQYATKRPVNIMYLGLDIIIKLKFTTNFDRCAILYVLSCLTKNFESTELIHNYKLVRIKAERNSRFFSLFIILAYIDYSSSINSIGLHSVVVTTVVFLSIYPGFKSR